MALRSFKSAALVVGAVALLLGCLPRPHSLVGRACDDAHPCPGDLVCQTNVCLREGEDDAFGSGDGRSGPFTVETGAVVGGEAGPLAEDVASGALSAGALEGTFTQGDLVLFFQTAGLPQIPPSGETETFDLTASTSGQFELARVASVRDEGSKRVLTLEAPLRNSYRAAGGQIVRVPEYSALNISAGATLAARPWDGRSGGVLAVLVHGTLHNDGVLSADGAGFRGGAAVQDIGHTGCDGLDFPLEYGGTHKGEGLALGGFGRSGKGNLVNGGGGGNCSVGGGGGGGHGGPGGRGGYTPVARDEGGWGGVPVRYSPLLQLSFGGGGGAGHMDGPANSSGGAGGGVLFVRAGAVTGAGSFRANGASGMDVRELVAGGGGGAGGLVRIQVEGTAECAIAEASGGNGGTVLPFERNGSTTDSHGPGGGGGGGRVLLRAAPGSRCPLRADSGLAGTQPAASAVLGLHHGAQPEEAERVKHAGTTLSLSSTDR